MKRSADDIALLFAKRRIPDATWLTSPAIFNLPVRLETSFFITIKQAKWIIDVFNDAFNNRGVAHDPDGQFEFEGTVYHYDITSLPKGHAKMRVWKNQ